MKERESELMFVCVYFRERHRQTDGERESVQVFTCVFVCSVRRHGSPPLQTKQGAGFEVISLPLPQSSRFT